MANFFLKLNGTLNGINCPIHKDNSISRVLLAEQLVATSAAGVIHPCADEQDSSNLFIAAVVASIYSRAYQHVCEIRTRLSKLNNLFMHYQGIQEGSRPTYCHLLWDNMDANADDLHMLTYCLVTYSRAALEACSQFRSSTLSWSPSMDASPTMVMVRQYSKPEMDVKLQYPELARIWFGSCKKRNLVSMELCSILLEQEYRRKLTDRTGGSNFPIEKCNRARVLLEEQLVMTAACVCVTQPCADQQDSSNASITAVVASVDPCAAQYVCEIQILASKRKYIEEMEDMFYQLFHMSHRSAGRIAAKPQRIIFYCDGVSVGKFAKMLEWKLPSGWKACLRLEKDKIPPITFVVVLKRYHTHLFTLIILVMSPVVKRMFRPELGWTATLLFRLRAFSSSCHIKTL